MLKSFSQYIFKENTALTLVIITGKCEHPTISKTFEYWIWGVFWGNHSPLVKEGDYRDQIIKGILKKVKFTVGL